MYWKDMHNALQKEDKMKTGYIFVASVDESNRSPIIENIAVLGDGDELAFLIKMDKRLAEDFLFLGGDCSYAQTMYLEHEIPIYECRYKIEEIHEETYKITRLSDQETYIYKQ